MAWVDKSYCRTLRVIDWAIGPDNSEPLGHNGRCLILMVTTAKKISSNLMKSLSKLYIGSCPVSQTSQQYVRCRFIVLSRLPPAATMLAMRITNAGPDASVRIHDAQQSFSIVDLVLY